MFFGLDRLVDDDAVRHVARERDRRKILDRVVFQVGVDERIDRERAIGSDQQSVAVGGRLGHELGADAAPRAAAIFDDHGLPQRLADLLADQPSDDVRIAAGGEGNDQADGAIRVGRKRPPRQQHGCRQNPQPRGELAARPPHGTLPGAVFFVPWRCRRADCDGKAYSLLGALTRVPPRRPNQRNAQQRWRRLSDCGAAGWVSAGQFPATAPSPCSGIRKSTVP